MRAHFRIESVRMALMANQAGGCPGRFSTNGPSAAGTWSVARPVTGFRHATVWMKKVKASPPRQRGSGWPEPPGGFSGAFTAVQELSAERGRASPQT